MTFRQKPLGTPVPRIEAAAPKTSRGGRPLKLTKDVKAFLETQKKKVNGGGDLSYLGSSDLRVVSKVSYLQTDSAPPTPSSTRKARAQRALSDITNVDQLTRPPKKASKDSKEDRSKAVFSKTKKSSSQIKESPASRLRKKFSTVEGNEDADTAKFKSIEHTPGGHIRRMQSMTARKRVVVETNRDTIFSGPGEADMLVQRFEFEERIEEEKKKEAERNHKLPSDKELAKNAAKIPRPPTTKLTVPPIEVTAKSLATLSGPRNYFPLPSDLSATHASAALEGKEQVKRSVRYHLLQNRLFRNKHAVAETTNKKNKNTKYVAVYASHLVNVKRLFSCAESRRIPVIVTQQQSLIHENKEIDLSRDSKGPTPILKQEKPSWFTPDGRGIETDIWEDGIKVSKQNREYSNILVDDVLGCGSSTVKAESATKATVAAKKR